MLDLNFSQEVGSRLMGKLGLYLDRLLTLYSARVTMSEIIQRQLQREKIDPINNVMVRLN